MSYRVSRSRRQFETDIRSYRSALRKADRNGVEPVLRQYAISAAIFLGHASFENYVRDLFGGIASALCATGIRSSKLPGELRMLVVANSNNWSSHFSKYAASGDERKLAQGLSAFFGNPKRPLVVDTDQVPVLSGTDLLGNRAYPSEGNLERIFARLGVSNLFDQLSGQLHADSRLLLKGLADKRTELAHNATIPGTSVQDVVNELSQFEAFVAALDRVSYRHVVAMVGDQNWTRSVA